MHKFSQQNHSLCKTSVFPRLSAFFKFAHQRNFVVLKLLNSTKKNNRQKRIWYWSNGSRSGEATLLKPFKNLVGFLAFSVRKPHFLTLRLTKSIRCFEFTLNFARSKLSVLITDFKNCNPMWWICVCVCVCAPIDLFINSKSTSFWLKN